MSKWDLDISVGIKRVGKDGTWYRYEQKISEDVGFKTKKDAEDAIGKTVKFIKEIKRHYDR